MLQYVHFTYFIIHNLEHNTTSYEITYFKGKAITSNGGGNSKNKAKACGPQRHVYSPLPKHNSES
jgi:hypothetical protein